MRPASVKNGGDGLNPFGEQGLEVHADGNANINVTVNGNSLFDPVDGNGIFIVAEGTGTVNATIIHIRNNNVTAPTDTVSGLANHGIEVNPVSKGAGDPSDSPPSPHWI